MTEWHESLDECIDRVTRSMTAVGTDAGIRTRVMARIEHTARDRRRAPRRPLAFGLAAIAAVAVAALWPARPSDESRASRVAGRSNIELPAVAAPAAAPSITAPDARSEGISVAVRSRAGARHTAERHLEESQGLSPLEAPRTIDTSMLEVPALDFAPVQVPPLTTPDLAVAVFSSSSEPRE